MTYRVSNLLADCFQIFASKKAQDEGLFLDRQLCAIWADAMRLAVSDIKALEDGFARVSHEVEQLRAERQSELIQHAKAGAPKPIVKSNVIDIGAILQRERVRNCSLPTDGGAA